jgi:hypothetical protein
MEKLINSPTKILSIFCPIIRISVLPTEDGGEIDKPTFLEATCKLRLHRTSPHQEIDLSKRDVEGTIEYQ